MLHLVWVVGVIVCGLVACNSQRTSGGDGLERDAGPVPAHGWQQVFTDLPGALISVSGTAADDVWAVGSDAVDGRGALILHYDGSEWQRLIVGQAVDLWWVHAAARDRVYFGGSSGSVLRYTGHGIERLRTPDAAGVVFGVWASSPEDVWAVGGDIERGSGAFVWRYDGSRWQSVQSPEFDGIRLLFKVWGTSAEDVWVVGAQGAVVHYDGNRWARVEGRTTESLFTVHGVAEPHHLAAAVGGNDLGVLLERNAGQMWAPAELPAATRQLFGVWLTQADGYAAGADATVLRRTTTGWQRIVTGLPTRKPLHAIWADPAGGVWAVGGDVLVPPLGNGVLIHQGEALPSAIRQTVVAVITADAGDSPEPRFDATAPDASPPDAGRDASLRDANDVQVPREASTHDASVSNDAVAQDVVVAVPDRIAGSIACGAQSCDAVSEQCCIDQAAVPLEPRCIAASASCPAGFFRMSCDQAADCASDQQCCLVRFIQFDIISHIGCQSRAEACGNLLCGGPADCGGGGCMASPWISSYEQCQ